MKITVKSEEKVGSKNHSAKRFCSMRELSCESSMITGEGWLSWKVRQLKRFVHAACGGDKS